jgi:hypothetical protein
VPQATARRLAGSWSNRAAAGHRDGAARCTAAVGGTATPALIRRFRSYTVYIENTVTDSDATADDAETEKDGSLTMLERFLNPKGRRTTKYEFSPSFSDDPELTSSLIGCLQHLQHLYGEFPESLGLLR